MTTTQFNARRLPATAELHYVGSTIVVVDCGPAKDRDATYAALWTGAIQAVGGNSYLTASGDLAGVQKTLPAEDFDMPFWIDVEGDIF